nr:hypothetical protein [uncultured Rhodoferax sp.]
MQGFAAASMLFCGMGMQHVDASASATAATDTPHDHTAMHGHSADVVHDASPDADHTCSICAACCNGVALVGLNHMATVPPAPQVQLAEPSVLIHTRATPVPDKPPRV